MALPDPYPRELVFVRHAESVGNVRTHQEKTRMPVGTNYFKLTARGERQAEITGRWLREHFPKPDRVISSHYVRPMQTALAAYPDENMRIAGRHQARGFPTVIAYSRGQELDRFHSAQPLHFLRSFIDKLVAQHTAP